MLSSKSFGIDFGTCCTKIYRKGTGLVFNQNTVLAMKGQGNVIAIGDEAYEMYEKSPESIQVAFPLINGRIAGFKNMLSLVNCIFMDITRYYGKFRGADFCIAIPYDLTSVEKHSFFDLLDSTIVRPKKITYVDKPIADAVGMGIDIKNNIGNLIINIGGETTEISVISQGGIVLSKLLPIGGNHMNQLIVSEIRKQYNLLVGNKTAENLKRSLANYDSDTTHTMKAFGRDLVTGLPREREISSTFVNDALMEHFRTIIDVVRSLLERTPPEIAADIYNKGIMITGGAAATPGVPALIGRSTGLNVTLAPNGSLTAIEGISKIMDSKELSAQYRNEAI